MNIKQMIGKFQCPGCVCGSSTNCGKYQSDEKPGDMCENHVLGTYLGGVGHFALGLPAGFNRSGYCLEKKNTHNKIYLRFFAAGTLPEWDVFNIPVWAKAEDGFLFVRTYMPRINGSYVDVIEGGDISLVLSAQNVTDLAMD